jgi:hypothetical protein
MTKLYAQTLACLFTATCLYTTSASAQQLPGHETSWITVDYNITKAESFYKRDAQIVQAIIKAMTNGTLHAFTQDDLSETCTNEAFFNLISKVEPQYGLDMCVARFSESVRLNMKKTLKVNQHTGEKITEIHALTLVYTNELNAQHHELNLASFSFQELKQELFSNDQWAFSEHETNDHDVFQMVNGNAVQTAQASHKIKIVKMK